eukprot:TRINITY_DN3136_c0_g1_i3.p1 TRINITY_DN3136_c0_g1~~TRINITY_DN3136_c0_g1_i3.p1  ORF type:complete len:590 (+),score=118.56 TRINITY_DN3136_c0_g1_i3:47-1816(+)
MDPPAGDNGRKSGKQRVPASWEEQHWRAQVAREPIHGGERLDAKWLQQFPLSTKGRHVVTCQGERFRLRGINWYGASDTKHVVGGLDAQSLDVICRTVSDLGFTVVRLPFSNEMLRCKELPEGAVNFDVNPQLRNLSAVEVFDEVVRALGRHKVAIILNNHTTYGEFCGPPSGNSVWFDPYGPFCEKQWFEDWLAVTRRYFRCPYVVGYDLRNEIRPRLSIWPTWGSGGQNGLRGRRDWSRTARHMALQLRGVNADALIVVERIVWPQRGLAAYAAWPGPLLPELQGKLVLAVHHYSWSGPGRFIPRWSVPRRWAWAVNRLRSIGLITKDNYGDMTTEGLRKQIELEWGFVLSRGLCPVWVSEFGAAAANPEEMSWLQKFVDILADYDADWAYWPLNVGPKPTCGNDEAYGMLAEDWTPKPRGDVRLSLLEKLGLPNCREEGAASPVKTTAINDAEAEGRLRELLSTKDPLFGVKHGPSFSSLTRLLEELAWPSRLPSPCMSSQAEEREPAVQTRPSVGTWFTVRVMPQRPADESPDWASPEPESLGISAAYKKKREDAAEDCPTTAGLTSCVLPVPLAETTRDVNLNR